jgi:integrase
MVRGGRKKPFDIGFKRSGEFAMHRKTPLASARIGGTDWGTVFLSDFRAMPLSNAKILGAKPSEKLFKLHDSGGLFLLVRTSGAKLWRYKYRIADKENVFALGEFYTDNKRPGHVSLEAARKARDEARELVRKGVHPSHAKAEKLRGQIELNNSTFKAVALEWMDRKKTRWIPAYGAQIRKIFDSDVFPHIGKLPISAVKPFQILEIMQRVEARGANSYAHLIRQWCSQIFRYAVATLRAEHDPAMPLKGAIIRKRPKHSRALSREELRAVLEKLRTYRGDLGTIYGIRIMVLTFVRTIELRGAKWSEFDFEAAEWRIPGERMKMRQEHVVPLSRQAIRLLEGLKKETGDGVYLFPNRRRPETYITSTTINRALERMGFLGQGTIGFSGHGFRSTASTMLNEAGFRADFIEKQLAHEDRNNVRASYNRATYLPERRQMMQKWADMIDQIMSPKLKVVG